MLDSLLGSVGGLVDRWQKATLAKIGGQALLRLLVLEARRNLGVLDVAVGGSAEASPELLWDIPGLLQTEMLETVLGQGDEANRALKAIRNLPVPGEDEGRDHGHFLMTLYVRISVLKSLSSLRPTHELANVRLQLRLSNIRESLVALVKNLPFA